MDIENNPSEIPPGNDVPAENPAPEIPPVETPTEVPAQNDPPPAANLVVNGDVKSEREIQLERELESARKAQRDAEFVAAEKERKTQELLEIQSRPPGVKRPKREPHWTDTFLGAAPEE